MIFHNTLSEAKDLKINSIPNQLDSVKSFSEIKRTKYEDTNLIKGSNSKVVMKNVATEFQKNKSFSRKQSNDSFSYKENEKPIKKESKPYDSNIAIGAFKRDHFLSLVNSSPYESKPHLSSKLEKFSDYSSKASHNNDENDSNFTANGQLKFNINSKDPNNKDHKFSNCSKRNVDKINNLNLAIDKGDNIVLVGNNGNLCDSKIDSTVQESYSNPKTSGSKNKHNIQIIRKENASKEPISIAKLEKKRPASKTNDSKFTDLKKLNKNENDGAGCDNISCACAIF